MKPFMTAVAAGLLLAACGGKNDGAAGDTAEQAHDNKTDELDAQVNELETKAANLRDEADRREEAIDDSATDAATLNAAQDAGAVNQQ